MGLVRHKGGMQLSKLSYLFFCIQLSISFPVLSGATEGAPKGILQDLPQEADEVDFRTWVVEGDKFNRDDDSQTNKYLEQVCCNLLLMWVKSKSQYSAGFVRVRVPWLPSSQGALYPKAYSHLMISRRISIAYVAIAT